MNVKSLFTEVTKTVIKFCNKNASSLLTAGGIALGGATVVIVAKKAPEAKERKEAAIKKAKDEGKSKAATAVDVVKATLPVYAPAIGTGALSVTCLVASNKISADRLAAMTAAYGVVQDKLDNYKKTAQEVLGETKAADLDRKAIERKMEDSKADEEKPEIPKNPDEGEKQLCYDVWSDRYFRASADDLRKAENRLNLQLFNGFDEPVTLNDWYDEIGLNQIPAANGWGWTAKSVGLKGGIDFQPQCVMSPNGVPCIGVDFDSLEPLWSAKMRHGY